MTFWCENFDKGEKSCKATFYSLERQSAKDARDHGWRFKFKPLSAPFEHRKFRAAYCPQCSKAPK